MSVQEGEPVHTIVFRFAGWSGWDLFRFEGRAPFPLAAIVWSILWIFFWPTRAAQVRRIARAMARGPYRDFDFTTHRLIVAMPWGAYEVTGATGSTRPARIDFPMVG